MTCRKCGHPIAENEAFVSCPPLPSEAGREVYHFYCFWWYRINKGK